jgi:hypothetical protein
MVKIEHVSEQLAAIVADLRSRRDNEVSMAAEILPQYVTDHNDKAAYRAIDRQVNALARAWDRMIALVERTEVRAIQIEVSCENFYGD